MLREKREEVDHLLAVTITRCGHEVPIPHGTAVKCIYRGVNLYDELETEIARPYPFPEERGVTMDEAGVGLVLDHRYHISHLELMRARIDPIFDSKKTKPRLSDVTEDLWYCIMFRKGHFWARYNWIEVLTTGVISDRGLPQRPEAG